MYLRWIKTLALAFTVFFIASTLFRVSAEQSNLSVTATVQARPADFQAHLAPLSQELVFSQNKVIEYEITYGSYLSGTANITVVGQWGLGTIDGAGSPSVDTVEYVVSSATNGYGGVVPIIDSINKKVKWEVSSFPPGTTDRKVKFAVRTKANYTGPSNVTFPVSAFVIGSGTQSEKATVNKKYKYLPPSSSSSSSGPTLTPTPTTNPVASITPLPTLTIAPTPTRAPLAFNSVTTQTISATDARVVVSTIRNATFTLRFGEKPGELSQVLRSTTQARQGAFYLEGLKPNTTYYYRVGAVGINGGTATSDIFTFKTALPSTQPEIADQSVVLTSNNVVLTNNTTEKNAVPSVPKDTPYSFQFTIPNDGLVKQVQTVLRRSDVLGLFSAEAEEPNTLIADAIQIKPGVYVGQLKTPSEPGYYELFVRITDLNGNIVENRLAKIKVTRKFTVKDKNTKNPVEAARVFFLVFNSQSKKYEPINLGATTIENPAYTDRAGELASVLSSGSYRAKITAIGYKDQDVDFKIGQDDGQVFPTVYLTPQPASLLSNFIYYGSVASDFFNHTKNYIKNISVSVRFFQFLTLVVVSIFIALSLIAFQIRINIPLWSLPAHILHHLRFHYTEGAGHDMLKGIVKNSKDEKIPGVDIYLLNPTTNRVVTHTISKEDGSFNFFKLSGENVKLLFMKDELMPTAKYHSLIDHDPADQFEVVMKKDGEGIPVLRRLLNIQRQLLGLSFETLLLISVVLELAVGYYFSWNRALPFLIISILNIFLWGIHSDLSRKKNVLFQLHP